MSMRDLRKVAPMWVNVSHAMFDDKEAHKARAPVCGRAEWRLWTPAPVRSSSRGRARKLAAGRLGPNPQLQHTTRARPPAGGGGRLDMTRGTHVTCALCRKARRGCPCALV